MERDALEQCVHLPQKAGVKIRCMGSVQAREQPLAGDAKGRRTKLVV